MKSRLSIRTCASTFAWLIFTCAAHGQESAARKPLTVDAYFEMRTVGDPQISPDGKRIVYTLATPDRMTDKRHTNLWIIDVDGKDNRPLTTGAFSDTSPRWSPDGTRIAYVSDRGGSSQIHVRWMDSSQETVITSGTPAPAAISWSPNCDWIAFTRRVPKKTVWDIQLPAKPANAKWGEMPIVVTELNWQVDGAGILRPGFTQIFVVPSTGGTPRQLTTGDFNHAAPKWMPNGETIVISADRSPEGNYNLEGSEIYALSAKDGAVKQLTSRRGPDISPTPSPDGKLIAYVGNDFTGKSYEVPKLYVMNSDGSHPRCLTDKLDRDVGEINWAPDGKSVVAAVQDRGTINLRRIDLSGKVEDVTAGSQVIGPFSISHDGRIACTRLRSAETSDVFTTSIRHSDLKQITRANEGLMSQSKVSGSEEIWFDSFDGKKVQGWIIKPPDFDPNRKYPLMLYIHGGPHAMYNVGFQLEWQVHAANGYVVLYTNPRGSTGYGHEFGVAIWRHYPEDDFRDLMAGVDAVLAKGYIDAKKMVMTGGSGGGCLTSWGIGHTDRFAAAAAQFPVTNWITQVGTADFGYFFGKMWMDGMPWENPKFYLDRSPIFYAKNFKTPTLVITGEEDRRTPIAESEELYFALKAQKIDTVLVRMPQEPHGAGSNYISHQIAKVMYLMKWFDKYIKGN